MLGEKRAHLDHIAIITLSENEYEPHTFLLKFNKLFMKI